MAKKKTTKVKEEPSIFYYKLEKNGGLYVKQLTLKLQPKKGYYWDLCSAKKLPIFYVVRVEYTTGDSFSTSPGQLTYTYLAETMEEGFAVAQAINEHYKKYQHGEFNGSKWGDQFKLQLVYKKKKINMSTSQWTGYFESLDGVDVVPVPVIE